MLRRFGSHVRNQWIGTVALFLVLTGGTAMAVDGSLPGQNTVGSADIIDGEVTSADIKPESIASSRIADRQVKNVDLGLGASSSNTIADGGVQGIDVKDNTLKGADIDESTLNGAVPLAAVATKASNTLGAIVNADGTLSSAAQSGTTSTRGALNSGFYTVQFGRDLANCAAVAALGNNLSNIPNPGEIGATINFDDSVTVQTRNSAGSVTDNGFELIVVC